MRMGGIGGEKEGDRPTSSIVGRRRVTFVEITSATPDARGPVLQHNEDAARIPHH